ncbi:MAG TPA: hypothetical protein VGG48_01070 [Rhizomicrobium sp.]
MHFSPPRLHRAVPLTTAHRTSIEKTLKSSRASTHQFTARLTLAPTDSVSIPLTTASLYSDFDAYIDVGFQGTATYETMIVDSGNNSLIVPRFEDIENLAGYTIVQKDVREPWGCKANLVRGPIVLDVDGGGTHSIPDCLFYACTADNTQPGAETRTANFGTGCLAPKAMAGTLQSVLAFEPTFTCAEFNYAPAQQVLGTSNDPKVSPGSLLTLHKTVPPGYQVFDIVVDPNVQWTSLRVMALSIGGVQTKWPGKPYPIAMIDTGGGSVLLSDPTGLLTGTQWPEQEPVPAGWFTQSTQCQATRESLTIQLGDDHGSYTYTVDTSVLSAAVQGRTLVLCQDNQYMFGHPGMNVGGISALTNSILLDYTNAKVGLKPKPAVATT